MDILTKSLEALWQVAAAALLLGAGLPALFALGVRSLASGRVPVSAGAAGSDLAATPRPTNLGLTGAVVCFGLCALAVVFGIVVIVWGKQLFGA